MIRVRRRPGPWCRCRRGTARWWRRPSHGRSRRRGSAAAGHCRRRTRPACPGRRGRRTGPPSSGRGNLRWFGAPAAVAPTASCRGPGHCVPRRTKYLGGPGYRPIRRTAARWRTGVARSPGRGWFRAASAESSPGPPTRRVRGPAAARRACSPRPGWRTARPARRARGPGSRCCARRASPRSGASTAGWRGRHPVRRAGPSTPATSRRQVPSAVRRPRPSACPARGARMR
ncbi:Uncharacterised protein [Mycobacteroides abscessus subsp. abscessus]|nr:Uncharacterised protein [Mycobacteroides abscessus subsp. abscessus]